MHDIRLIRDDPAAFDAALARRGFGQVSFALLEIEGIARSAIERTQKANEMRKELASQVGQAKRAGYDDLLEDLFDRGNELKKLLQEIEDGRKEAVASLNTHLTALPNTPSDDTPDGQSEDDNVEVGRWSAPAAFDFAPRPHDEIAAALGLDTDAAGAMSGARFAVLRGKLARMQRGLGQFLLDAQVAAGWEEVAVPLLVRDEAVFGTGQLPKFADDLFHTTDGRWLIPTAEVPLTNLVREQVLDEGALPVRVAALTPCFRSEAGAAGKDTRGLIRQHQFDKVELVTVCHPDSWKAEHERMLQAAQAVLEALELPYRTMQLCAGDLGVSAKRTFDLEVWLPSQDTYREISSISWCGDWQARRMDARFKVPGQKGTTFVHTLNGSGVAVGRALVAILENGQRADGSVALPGALHPYLPAEWNGELRP